MMPTGNYKYINVSFILFIFILTFAFSKEYFVTFYPALGGAVSALIAVVFTLIVFWVFRKQNLIIKLFVVLSYIFFIAIVVNYSEKHKTLPNSLEASYSLDSIQGGWVLRENDLILILNFGKKNMRMTFYPDNKQLAFEYEAQGKIINFYNDNEVENFQWQILKLSSDSMIVLEKDQVLKFKRDYD